MKPEQAARLAAELFPSGFEADPVASLPTTIGSYKIRRLIAMGGFGAVYEAEQAAPRRVVALKVLHRAMRLRDETIRRRFEYEAELLAHLRHPSIAQIYEADTCEIDGMDVPFFAMEYIPDAKDIVTYCNDEPLSLSERTDLFINVCEAVGHGCRLGIVHRDLKPTNILVGSDGCPRIIDFGVARSTGTDLAVTTMHTGTGELIGTVQYMSPEQCEGDPAHIGPASDVYALGVILYELLSGRLPYDLSTMSLPKATRIVQEVMPPPPSQFSRRLRGNLEAICLKALAKDSRQRYASAIELGADLRSHRRGEPIDARPPAPWLKMAQWIARHPIGASTAAALAIILAAVATVSVTDRLYWSRPYSVRVADDGRVAQLLSVGGIALHEWRSTIEGGIRTGQLAVQPRELGGRTLVLLDYSKDPENRFAGALCAFDAAHPDVEPLWWTRIESADTPLLFRERGLLAAGFGAEIVETRGILDDVPGDEILVTFHHTPTSAACLRIYDLAGSVRFQFWHDGPFQDVHWLPEPRLLVVAALDSTASWGELGVRTENSDLDPLVVFAVRPQSGLRATEWLPEEPALPQGYPEWIMWFPPCAADERTVLRIHPALPGEDAASYLRLDVHLLARRDAAFTWLVDSEGRVAADSVVPNNTFRTLADPLDPAAFLPGPLEEVIARSQVGGD